MFAGVGQPAVAAATPSFDCAKVRAGSVEADVCADPALAKLDRRLAAAYRHATTKAANEHPPRLKAEQRGWLRRVTDSSRPRGRSPVPAAATLPTR
jgi:uncharacterized protein